MKNYSKSNILKSLRRAVNDAEIKLIHAKDFTPHKIGYYEDMLKSAVAELDRIENTHYSKITDY